jgi:hypothetical protein
MALRLQEAAEAHLDEAEERLHQFEAVNASDNREKALATLTYDLEAACNLLIRISVALGIQPGGDFYENIKDLVEKYGMEMRHATDYEYDPQMGIRSTDKDGWNDSAISAPTTVSAILEEGRKENQKQLEGAPERNWLKETDE